MTDPWRWRCPKGHASLETAREKDGYRCKSCGERYHGSPHDAAETEFPVQAEPAMTADKDSVLEALVKACENPLISRRKASHLSDNPESAGCVLAQLRKEGLVERLNTNKSRRYHWRPTEAGRQKVLRDKRAEALNDRGSRFGRARGQVRPIGYVALAIEMLFFAGFLFWLGVAL